MFDWAVRAGHAFMARVLKAGPVPKRIAFIMDGNRRFARTHNMRIASGHEQGFERLLDVLQWSLELGVVEVSMFAFSIKNFARSEAEVADLMRMSLEKLNEALDQEFVRPLSPSKQRYHRDSSSEIGLSSTA